MNGLPLDHDSDPSRNNANDLTGTSMPARSVDYSDMLLAADFCNYREHLGADHKLRPGSATHQALQKAILQVGRLFEVETASPSGASQERFSAVCALGGATSDERRAVALMEGITSSATKFNLPAGTLKFHQPSSKEEIYPIQMPQVEVFDQAAGIVVSVERGKGKSVSLSLILTKDAFDQAVSHIVEVGQFLDETCQNDRYACSCSLPAASSLFALLFHEVRSHEAPILGVKRLVGPSKNFVFQVSVLSIGEGAGESSFLVPNAVQEATHHIAVRQNEYGIVESHWLARTAR